jgi:H+/Cl- antiporter ClcA
VIGHKDGTAAFGIDSRQSPFGDGLDASENAKESKFSRALTLKQYLAADHIGIGYNVPLGGTLFTLEVLLGTFNWAALIPALATCVIATVVAWFGLGNGAQYALPPLSISPSLVVWSIVMGPVFGAGAYRLVHSARAARAHAPKDWRLPLWCGVVFPAIGVLAIPFPQLLGNGIRTGSDGL